MPVYNLGDERLQVGTERLHHRHQVQLRDNQAKKPGSAPAPASDQSSQDVTPGPVPRPEREPSWRISGPRA